MRESSLQCLSLAPDKTEAFDKLSIPMRSLAERLAKALTNGSAVVVVKDEDLPDILKALGPIAVERPEKHPKVGLARVATGRKHITTLRVNYRTAGRLLRGLRALLEHARHQGDRYGCIVGVTPDVFHAAWDRGRHGAAPGLAAPEPAPGHGPSLLHLFMQEPEDETLVDRLGGTSPHIRQVRQLIMRAARSRQAVLLLGDAGAGKGVVAQAICDLSGRQGRWVYANALTLAASADFELQVFGCARTGSGRGRPPATTCLWDLAGDEGTLYLDEISALHPDHQAMLEGALRSGAFRYRTGHTRDLPRAQVIASSSRDLAALVRSGEFIPSLFYLLREFTIRVPSLRERPEDIPVIARQLWTDCAGTATPPLPERVLAELQAYAWPGNVRELKSVLSALYTLFGNARLTPDHVRTVMLGQGYARPADPAQGGQPESAETRLNCLRHLLRAEDTVLALQAFLTERQIRKARSMAALPAEAISRLQAELELLLLSPASFGSPTVYTLMNDLKGKLSYAQGLSARASGPAFQRLMKELPPALTRTAVDLRREVNRWLA